MISVVIPSFNSAKLLQKNLPRLIKLLNSSKLNFEIIVVDDASTDKSVNLLRSHLANQGETFLRIIENPKNLGFASTVDRGIRAARGEIVFTLKTDSLPASPDYFKLMLKHFKNKQVFSVTAALKTMENGKEEIRGAGEIYFEKGFFLHRRSQFFVD
ncbi:glycosyltransferase family 2 protein [Candidatus Gottesmanbacteria bacterium]|nr:glycosyltransferase family 2 protein [Candidatus Gottesmanbacteria bacterium]